MRKLEEGDGMAKYRDALPQLGGDWFLTDVNILGGCCGTDHRHVDVIFEACAVG